MQLIGPVETLGKLEPAALAQRADSIVPNSIMPSASVTRRRPCVADSGQAGAGGPRAARGRRHSKLEDSDCSCSAAVETLGMLEARRLRWHATSSSPSSIMPSRACAAAVQALGKLEPAALAQRSRIVARLEDSGQPVRSAAVETLRKLGGGGLRATHSPCSRTPSIPCGAARGTLGKLEPAVLAGHADDIIAKLNHPEGDVRTAALYALGKLEPAALAGHADAVAMLKVPDPDNPLALKTLCKLGGGGCRTAAVRSMLKHHDWDVPVRQRLLGQATGGSSRAGEQVDPSKLG